MAERKRPNILVTGTPGTGKTTLAAAVAAASGLTHVDVGTAIREQELHCGWDDDFECHIVDEDKVRETRQRVRAATPVARTQRMRGLLAARAARPGLASLVSRGRGRAHPRASSRRARRCPHCASHSLTRARSWRLSRRPQVVDALEAQMSAGGVVADYHSSEFFPERCGPAARCASQPTRRATSARMETR